MPNAPLPKPATPVLKAPTAAGTPPQNSTTSGSTAAPTQSGNVFPPQSQLKMGTPPVASRISQPNPQTTSSTQMSNPSAPVPPVNTSTNTVRTTPNRPPIQVARPGSPLPMQPANPKLGSQQTSSAPQPSGVTAPIAPTPAQQPPRTLSALQSMSSPNLPSTGDGSADTKAAPVTSSVAPAYGVPKPPSGTPPQAGGDKKPEFAAPKKSPLRFLPFILGGVLLLAILGYVGFRLLAGNRTPVSDSQSSTSKSSTTPAQTAPTVVLEYWGLWEPSETMAQVIKDYETQNPGVSINYTKQSHVDYRVRLNTALVQGQNGPDIFRYHASWVPMLKEELAVLPSSIMTSQEYQTTFYPVAGQMLNVQGQIVGIPLMYDGLALYYNKDIFSTAVLEPPTTWPDLRTIASKLTVTAGNNITRSGVALGNSTNVEHFSDILALLMMQNKADLLNPNSPETRDALQFYVNFVKTDKVWNDTLPQSSVAFARGDVAMIFAPSWRALEIKEMNPNLQFGVVPLPQLDDTKKTYANFWAEGVNAKSSKKDAAWKFLKYLSSAEVQKKLYADQSEVRPFGELYSRKDLADSLATDPVASAYLQDAPYAQGSYMSSYTHDQGLNDQIIQYYEDAVTALVSGTDVEDVLITLDQGVKQTLRQYGVTTTPDTTTSN